MRFLYNKSKNTRFVKHSSFNVAKIQHPLDAFRLNDKFVQVLCVTHSFTAEYLFIIFSVSTRKSIYKVFRYSVFSFFKSDDDICEK